MHNNAQDATASYLHPRGHGNEGYNISMGPKAH